MALSRTQVDKLGERLKAGPISEADLRALDHYRRSFAAAYEHVVERLRSIRLDPTGRPAKSTSAIVEKLRRESIRLSQIQDIAGCRVVVGSLDLQDQVVAHVSQQFDRTDVTDRRQRPSHGYRAVHLVVTVGDAAVEVQVRTDWQHTWAQTSEKLADTIDPAIKYGRGPADLTQRLESWAVAVHEWELLMPVRRDASKLQSMRERVEQASDDLLEAYAALMDIVDRWEEGKSR